MTDYQRGWYQQAEQRVLMLLAEGWKVSLSGNGDFAFFSKADDYYQYPSCEFFRYAAAMLSGNRRNYISEEVRRCKHAMWYHCNGSGI